MENETTETIDAPAVVAAAVSEAYSEGVATAGDIVEHAVANAEAEAEAARELSERLTDAAIEGERGRRIATLENRTEEIWHAVENLQSLLATLSEQLNRLSQSQATIVGMELQEAATASSIPVPSLTPISEVTSEAEALAEILPENLSESVVVESPAAPPPRKARRLI